MPPSPSITRQQVLDAAVGLVREGGLDSVNARAIAAALGCSTKPLFRLYRSMDELKAELKLRLDEIYASYMEERLKGENRLVRQGVAYIEFARSEGAVFNALFMHRTMAGSTLQGVADAEWNRSSIEDVMGVTGCDRTRAERIFLSVWLYAHGIATQIVSNELDIPSSEVSELIEDAFDRFAR